MTFLTLPPEWENRYTPIEQMTVNTLSETYLLENIASGCLYVLKINEAPEASILQGLTYRGVPAYLSEVQYSGKYYTLREYIEGITLEEYVNDHALECRTNALRIIKNLCDILIFLHNRPNPIIHRDIKPGNVIINPHTHEVTLIDFGIARLYKKEAKKDTVSFGTAVYAPPEQYGFEQTDHRTDIYSLGILFRYLLTGHLERDYPLPDKGLESIARKCTAYEPAARYQNAKVLKRALIAYEQKWVGKLVRIGLAAAAACIVFVLGYLAGMEANGLPVFPEKYYAANIIDAPQAFTFREPVIEAAVRLMLDIPENENVYYSDLARVTRIYVIANEAFRTREEVLITENYPTFWQLERGSLYCLPLQHLRSWIRYVLTPHKSVTCIR
ncbi:MAG: serine/threonine protein kinase [Defluviitaleaceae bacterium]|nr:serine/threonine protein kinase [Defluviitaleaceae bacterium]MCL2275496.1 serine/threonine protein kinase [Defluviitaleaceae bacterium]